MTHHLTAMVVKIQQMVRVHLAKQELDWLRIQKMDERHYETENEGRPDAEEWVEMWRYANTHEDY
jgi:hypothetical protein